MSRVAPLSRNFLRRLALVASLIALAMLSLPQFADAGERRSKGAHGKRSHAAARHHAPRIKNVGGRRSDLYGHARPKHYRNGHPAYRSGAQLASGRRTEGVYGYRRGWGGSGVYRVRESTAERVRSVRAFDRPYDGYTNGRGYGGLGYGLPLVIGADSGYRRGETTSERVRSIRAFDRPYDGYYNGRGYGFRGGSYGTPQIIQVTPSGEAPVAAPVMAPTMEGALLEGDCALDQFCTVRLGPYTNSPKIITLNTTDAPVGPDTSKEVPPGDEPEVYEAPEGEPVK